MVDEWLYARGAIETFHVLQPDYVFQEGEEVIGPYAEVAEVTKVYPPGQDTLQIQRPDSTPQNLRREAFMPTKFLRKDNLYLPR